MSQTDDALSTDRRPWALRMTPQGVFHALASKSVLSLCDQAIVSGANFLAAVILGRRSGFAELGLYVLGFAVLVFVVNIHAALIVAPFTYYANHCGGERR